MQVCEYSWFFCWILVTPFPPSVDPCWIDFQMWLRDELNSVQLKKLYSSNWFHSLESVLNFWSLLCWIFTEFPWSALKLGLTFANLALKIARQKGDDFFASWNAFVRCIIAKGIRLTILRLRKRTKKSLVWSANWWETTRRAIAGACSTRYSRPCLHQWTGVF